jgi:DNA-binding transcriptional regulator YdaS (Cro superfamily)
MNAIRLAVDQIGSGVETARMCRVKPQMVSQWLHGVRPVSPRCALLIAAHPKVTVTCNDLRPDVFGEPQDIKAA